MTNHELAFFPEHARAYCSQLLRQYDFTFKIKRERQTKLGDYRRARNGRKAMVTVNENLTPESFLITYIHEVAHHAAYEKYGSNIRPHGVEWKQTFKELLQPVLNPEVFSPAILPVLQKHMRNPKASSASDPKLWQLLNPQEVRGITLNSIENGTSFEFKDRIFRKIVKRRTRVLCEEQATNRRFLIPAIAPVQVID